MRVWPFRSNLRATEEENQLVNILHENGPYLDFDVRIFSPSLNQIGIKAQ